MTVGETPTETNSTASIRDDDLRQGKAHGYTRTHLVDLERYCCREHPTPFAVVRG